jgi:hypothetical protein
METDIGNPIEYNPVLENVPEEKDENNEKSAEEYDKTTWILIFGVFLLGFFMGKTMQPVILRYT